MVTFKIPKGKKGLFVPLIRRTFGLHSVKSAMDLINANDGEFEVALDELNRRDLLLLVREGLVSKEVLR